MATSVTLKANDTYPALSFTLSDENGPVDLSAADSVKILMKSTTLATPVSVSGTCTVDADQTTNKGKGTYAWGADETANADTYNCEFEVTWDANTTPPEVETFPNTGYLTIVIEADLG